MKLRTMVIVIICLSVSGLFAAKQNEREKYQLASNFERSGQYAKAESLYVDLFNSNPDNYNYFSSYKNALILQRKYDKIKPLLEARYNKNQRDQYTRLELSVVCFALGEKKEAKKHWEYLFSPKFSQMHRSYSNSIYNKVLEYHIGSSFYEIVDELRKITNKSKLLVMYNFPTSLRFRNWEQAIDEILHIIKNDPIDLKYVRPYLFLQDPDSDLYQNALKRLSHVKQAEAQILMSDINLHIKDYEAALENLSTMNEDPMIQSTLEKLARTLIDKEEYDLSYTAAKRALDYGRNPLINENMHFLMAESLRGKFEKNNRIETLIPKPFASKITDLPMQSFEASDIVLIENAYAIYDSLSFGSGKISEKATLKQIEIEQRVYQDIDAALQRALKILPKISIENRVSLLEEIAKLYMAKGDIENAHDFISIAPKKYSLMVHEEDRLLVTELHTSILYGEIDSLTKKMQIVLSLLTRDDPMYNDVLNYMAFISVMAKDSTNHKNWQKAERELMQQNSAKAAEIYLSLLQGETDAKFVYALRYLDCLQVMKDEEAERSFWEKNYSELKGIEMSDYFMLAYAGFLENIKKSEKAVEIYEEFLLSYQESMYLEKVRNYLRQIK